MNRNPHKKTLNPLFVILIIVLFFGCENTKEPRLLIISSKQSKDNQDKIQTMTQIESEVQAEIVALQIAQADVTP